MGFNISLTPSFSVSKFGLDGAGRGVCGGETLRGGGEIIGESWHQQGIKLNKQNVFDDFIGGRLSG